MVKKVKSDEFYEVRGIIGHRRNQYLVLWMRYERASWEPQANLMTSCQDVIDRYWERRRIRTMAVNIPFSSFQRNSARLKSRISAHLKTMKPRNRIRLSNEDVQDLNYKVLHDDQSLDRWDIETLIAYLDKSIQFELSPDEIDDLNLELLKMHLTEKRRRQVEKLKKIQGNLKKAGYRSVTLKNWVDFSIPTHLLKYRWLRQKKLTRKQRQCQRGRREAVAVPEGSVGCTGATKGHCCKTSPYTKTRKLKAGSNNSKLIVECNSACDCGVKCCNKLVTMSQISVDLDLEIYKTDNGRGWGVRTLQVIKKGEYLGQYAGTLMSLEEASQKADKRYQFGLLGDNFVMDAFRAGNWTAFINHACWPNLTGYHVSRVGDDYSKSTIAFFANKNIYPGQELSIYYSKDYKDQYFRGGCKCHCCNKRKLRCPSN